MVQINVRGSGICRARSQGLWHLSRPEWEAPAFREECFEYIFVQIMDFLSGKGVDVMTQTASFKPMTTQVVSLHYYLENLPASGASGLLYMIIERPRNFKYTIRVQCFDEFFGKRQATVERESV